MVNPHWSGEKVFQETRRIVIAEWHHIVYDEWLPILLGSSYMNKTGLLPLSSGYSIDTTETKTQQFTTSLQPLLSDLVIWSLAIGPKIPVKDCRRLYGNTFSPLHVGLPSITLPKLVA